MTVFAGVLVAATGVNMVAAQGFYDDAVYRLAAGRGSWQELDAWADKGYGDAIAKGLSHRIASEFRAGATAPSAETRQALEQASAILRNRSISALLAALPIIGSTHAYWDGDALPALLERVRAGDRFAISLACRLAALPGESMGTPIDTCRTGVRLGMADAMVALAILHHRRPDDFDNGFEKKAAETLKVSQSRAEAITLYRTAVAKGHPVALARLAHLTAIGGGVSKDDVEARRLATLAAEQGNAEGRTVLGLLLLQGRGGAPEPERARALLIQAARSGNRMAQLTLATLSLHGQGAPLDFTDALTWVHLAATSQRGDPPRAEADRLLLEPMERTRSHAAFIGNVAIDLDARIRAAQLRKELADSGEWPLVDPIPAAFPPQR
ncbi:MAG: sel1 repeat family protein [Alphaproteobacteria bacterium]|nr:sel1 repeat family protein [Alphaproteobacteria bacterium]